MNKKYNILFLFMLLLGSMGTKAQTVKGKSYEVEDKSLNEIFNESSNPIIGIATCFSVFNKDYVHGGGAVIGEVNLVSNTIRNTFINNTILKLFHFGYSEHINEYWISRVYGPCFGETAYLDAFELSLKDSTLFDYHFIPVEKRTETNMAVSQFCYEQILPVNLTKEEKAEVMLGDLGRFFRLKYEMLITLEAFNVSGFLLKRTNQNTITEKEVRMKLKHLGNREFQSIADFETVFDQFFRPTGTENISQAPYVFDVDGENKKRKIIMPIWKKSDKLEDFILALNANGLELNKGEQRVAKIIINDDLSGYGL